MVAINLSKVGEGEGEGVVVKELMLNRPFGRKVVIGGGAGGKVEEETRGRTVEKWAEGGDLGRTVVEKLAGR